MAESYAACGETARDEAVRLTAASTSGPGLACYACKRRKVKCDRQQPICSLCNKSNVVCEYPSRAEKPGPKTGSLQGAKRRRVDDYTGHTSGTSGIDSLLNAAGVEYAVPDLAQRDPVLSPRETRVVASEGAPSVSSPVSVRPSSSHPTNAPIFSRIMYPSHEAQTRPQSPSTVDTPPDHRNGASRITVQTVCEALKLSKETYDTLMKSYFTNMTAFSLFRPGSIEPKFAVMQHHSEAEALVAAIFSFSARHCCDSASQTSDCPSSSYFAQIAVSRLDESVDRYGDIRPPFWLFQAGVLVTFYQLTMSVRSRSWKRLGDCIRYAYDMNLHLVDANHDPNVPQDRETVNNQRWVLLEERRRAWWAAWEMDVFASTIRRLPTAIDASLNLTMLPVPDSCWFNDKYQESCFLAEDPGLRWKHLAESGNESAKAWFIVINSVMRNTQRIVYPSGSAIRILNNNSTETNQDELNIVANCLYCTVTSLPPALAYQGETLDFRSKQEHADKYSVHLMTQLCRFMIYHHKICARAPWLHAQNKDNHGNESDADTTQQAQATLNSEWSNYMSASDEIVTIVRNSARDHYKYVNPFLANTLWFAAATQCACRVFGPASFNKRLASSNLDLLKLTFDRFISFWGGMENLKGRLARIETGLQNLMAVSWGQGQGQGRSQGAGPPGLGVQSQIPVDPGIIAAQNGSGSGIRAGIGTHVTGAEPLLVLPGPATGLAMNGGWNGDPRWSSSSFPDLVDLTQHFPMTSHGFYPMDPLDLSPFGLEELLMVNMDTGL